jgi:hypothetical protein
LCTLLFYQHNLCQAKSDSTPSKQQPNLTPCSARLHPWYWESHNHQKVTYQNCHLSIVLPLLLPYYAERLTP